MKRISFVAAAAACAITPMAASPAFAGEPFIGELRAYSNTYCPRGWQEADGQLLPIAQHTAMYSLLGTTFGGDGRSTFALPDLKGRSLNGVGRMPGGNFDYRLGQRSGVSSAAISVANMPVHNHEVQASTETVNSTQGTNDHFGGFGAFPAYGTSASSSTMNSSAVTYTGQGQPFDLGQPALTVRWCIALEGLYPSRS